MTLYVFYCMCIAGGLVAITAFARYWTKHITIKGFNIMLIIAECLILPLTIMNLTIEKSQTNITVFIVVALVLFLNIIWLLSYQDMKKIKGVPLKNRKITEKE